METESYMRMNDNVGDHHFMRRGMARSSSPSRSLPVPSPPLIAVGVGVNRGGNHIIHTVSRFDTLAGVAIKYGVEVADIKKLNGLVTDLQMFALETIQIPLPGRHPPSPSLSNGHETPQRPSSSGKQKIIRRHSDLFDSFQSLKSSPDREMSPAMSILQGYYGLSSKPHHYRKSRSISNCYISEEVESNDSDNFSYPTPEMLLKEENTTPGPISAITGKGLALRPKSTSRNVYDHCGGAEGDQADSFGVNGVRKSSSTSCLQDSDNRMLLSLWNMKPDFQALTTAAITRPIFDGLPKPMTRRNKAALD